MQTSSARNEEGQLYRWRKLNITDHRRLSTITCIHAPELADRALSGGSSSSDFPDLVAEEKMSYFTQE